METIFKTLQSDMLQSNKIILDKAFRSLNNLIHINYVEKKGSINEHCCEFTYYNSFNQWSHSVKIFANESGVYFKTYRIDAYEDLLPYEFTTYSHNQIGAKIPISETDLIIKVLTSYDRFLYK